MKVEVELISKELIKPTSPTPHHLRHLQLSFIDQIQLQVCMPLVFFYSKETNINNLERCKQLKKSLSSALTIFYPLAGRINNNTLIDCNDEGALFVEAQANCELSDILQRSNPSDDNNFIPLQPEEGTEFVSFFQVTLFKCGGLAISFAMSHKLGDALSQFTFLNGWAAIHRGNNDITIPPFGTAAFFPPTKVPGYDRKISFAKESVTKIFVFDPSALADLVKKYTDKNGNRPSKVEALAAFIWNRFKAATGANKKFFEHYIWQMVNLRQRMDPPLPKEYFGNVFSLAIAEVNKDEEGYGIVRQMKEAMRKVNNEYVKSLQKSSDGQLNFLEENTRRSEKGEAISFVFTSLCKFPMYDVDFGWGKPVRVGLSRFAAKNFVIFFDSKEGQSIVAWVTLAEEDMAKFEIDQELLSYFRSSPNENSSTDQTLKLESRSRL